MAFNLYDAVKMITDYKTGWHEADKAGKKDEAKKYAELAKPIYEQLVSNGYSDVAKVLENSNDVRAKEYLATFNKNTTPDSSMPEAKDITTADGMITDIYGIQRTNMGDMKNKYDFLEDYNINHNPYESDIGKSIMANYQYQGKTASENAVASGGASNGGNIDSYAAANANRQQLAFTNAGNQAILNDFNARIGNYRGILNDMGINLQNQEKGMQTTAGMKQTEEQRTFENDETYRNNEIDRNIKVSEVTGYVPDIWKVDTSTAQQTESGRQFDKNVDTTKALTESELASQEKRTQAEIEADIKKNNADNATKLQITDKELSANSQSEEVTFDDFKANIKIPTTDYGSWTFVNKVIKEYWNNGADVVFESTDFDESGKVIKYPEGKLPLKTLLLDNAKKYGITADGAKAISSVFGFSPTWVDNYDVWYDTKAKKDEEPEYKPEDVK